MTLMKPQTEPASVPRRAAVNIVAGLARLVGPMRVRPSQPWLWPWRKLAIAVALTVAVFLLIMSLLDVRAIVGARALPQWFKDIFDWITDYGKSGYFLWPLGLLFIGLAALPPLSPVSQRVVASMMVRVGFLFTAIALPGIATNAVKYVIGRARPFVGGSPDAFLYAPFNGSAAYASMPSGHTTTALSVVVAFGILWPRLRPYLLIYALLICISRVVVTAHHPSDVLGGALMGTFGALLVARYFALRRLGFSIRPDGGLHGYPGPSWRRIKSVARELLA
jgi:membrane-associated phospholipid phosphatase